MYDLSKSLIRMIVIYSMLILCGCEQTRKSTDVHPYHKHRFEAPAVNIKSKLYKSVQERKLDGQDPDLAVVVAISGGGQRAANFGAGVLIGLEEIVNGKTNALAEVDYFSTVSGGGMTAAGYISSLYDYLGANNNDRQGYSFLAAMTYPEGKETKDMKKLCKGCREYHSDSGADWPNSQVTDPCLRRHFSRGYNNNLFRGFCENLLQIITFSGTGFKFGNELEETFDNEILGRKWRKNKQDKSLTFGDMFIPPDDPDDPQSSEDVRLPYWIPNATVFENGAIFPFTPDILKLYEITGYTHNHDEIECSMDDFSNVPLAVGLTASGDFPLIPAITLNSTKDPSNRFLHLYDGGLSDNLGVITACNILRQEITKRKVLIVVDAYTGNFAPYSSKKCAPFLRNFAEKQLTSLPLDSWRGRYKYITEWLLKSDENAGDTAVIFISFDDLYNENKSRTVSKDSEYDNGIMLALENNYGYNFDKGGFKNLEKYLKKHKRTCTPHIAARSIKTSYNISAHEQDFLLAIGRYLVNEKKDKITSALWPKTSNEKENLKNSSK